MIVDAVDERWKMCGEVLESLERHRVNGFDLERFHETLGLGVIIWIASSAHGASDAIGGQYCTVRSNFLDGRQRAVQKVDEVTEYLVSPLNVTLPLWFRSHWGDEVRNVQTKLLPPDLGLTEQEAPEGFALKTAATERAALEILHLAPKEFDLVEAGMIIDSMTSIRPKLMQTLLEQCASIKVRRLFLYLAERAGLPVMRHLDLDRIDLGSGDRSLVPDGRYVAKYQLSLPKELVERG